MSDELIEGRSLRENKPGAAPEQVRARRETRAKPRAEDEPSGPYVALEPPPEAGNVIRDQAEQATYHRKLQPVVIDESAPAPAGEPDSSAPAPDLPWEVIEAAAEEEPSPAQPPAPAASTLPEPDSQPIMRLPKVESTPPEAKRPVAKAERDEDSGPKFSPAASKPAPVPNLPEDFIPHLHTPTGALPVVQDEDDRLTEQPPPTKRRADAPSGRQTPGVMRPVESDDDEIAELYRKPSDEPSAAPRRRDEPSGEVVDAEWVAEMGGRGEDISDRIEARLRAKRDQSRAAAPSRPANWRTLALVGVSAAIVLAAVIYRLWPVLVGGAALAPSPTPTLDATPMEITPLPGESGATEPPTQPPAETALSGEGRQQGRLVFSSNRDGNYELYLMVNSTGDVKRLTNRAPADRFPAWSPDGRQIVFVSDAGQNDDLWLISATGGEPVQLTTHPGSDRNPTWSPDGAKIVFSREDVDGSRLMVLPASCLSQPETCEALLTVLTPGGYDRFPAWAPDGGKLAFSASDLPGGASVVALLNPDGSGYAALRGTATSDFGPVWSPDGARIAFVSYARGDYDVWIMAADSSALAQVTRNAATDTSPAWSPNGEWLVFASDRGAQANFHLWLVPVACVAAGTCEDQMIALTSAPGVDDLDPAWSP